MNTPKIPINLEIAREIARQGELRLTGIMALAIAQDARATTLCGTFGAASIALAAGVLAYVGTDHHDSVLILSGAVTAALLFVAAIVAAYAGAPSEFWIPGGMPRDLRKWAWDVEHHRWRTEIEMLDATAQRLAIYIDRDKKALQREGRLVRLSQGIAFAAAIFGVACFLGRHHV
jgi:hypothetical protein